ncbi:MAG: ATP-binding protein [Oryzomonas sp.]|uniref:ATP-binding protein n=1 Tax=Oryzomonas sp. TaxID=2855186 RepID=UPI002849BAFF|nr:ATP-binding protein [Oryzomonas sp.]MDR3579245.1 ATP-binding protein [Oryzomonas sp.]
MRTQFVKIFLWFWLAITLASIANFILAITSHSSIRATYRRNLAEEHRQTLEQMLAIFSGNIPMPPKRCHDRACRNKSPATEIRICLFSSDGGKLLDGGPVSRTMQEAATRAAQSRTAETVNREGYLAMAKPVVGSSGGSYVAAVGMPVISRWAEPDWLLLTRIHSLYQVVSLLIGGVVCYILAWRLTAPIRRLRTAAQRLACGDLSARVGMSPQKPGDEVADLGHDLDRMAERIETLVESQKRLLRDISHELRSPLARINVALGLVRRNGSPSGERYLDRIEAETERLNELIGQLLTLTVLESGSEQLQRETVDLENLVREVVDDAGFEAEEHNRRVLIIACEALQISGNREMLRRVVENVVRNAVRYTDEGTAVEIVLHAVQHDGGPCAVLTVRDHGPGVPEAALTNIFRPFYRVADARDRQSGGTGIGLAIVERALHMHNGTVTARNALEGGLIVEIRLPIHEEG